MTSAMRETPGRARASVHVRTMATADLQAAQRVLMESPEASMWSAESLRASLSRGLALVVELDGSVAGVLIGRIAADESEILNLAVGREYRRRGAGASLVLAAIAQAQAAGAVQVYLEVRESNDAARALYKSMGFRECGRRTNYYRDPVEDAVLLVFHTAEPKQ